MPKRFRVALITGATRGIGYNVGKEMVKRMPLTTTYMTSRHNVDGFQSILGMQLGAAARERAKFVRMDVRDLEAVNEMKEKIVKKFGGLDILVNNAGIYHVPNKSLSVFPKQVQEILGINYWGTKNVIGSFFPHFKPHSRIVNITSNLGHIMSVKSMEDELKEALRLRFNSCSNEFELDGLLLKFQRDAIQGTWRKEGWPSCGYTVSKMAINAYTRILQTQFDEDDREDVVVNAVYPCTKHSKIDQSDMKILDDEEGAKFVFYMAAVKPNSHGVFPRGAVIWNNSRVVDNRDGYTYNNKHQQQLPLEIEQV
eukprot:GFUD01137669.1.p1 GENE.GFUD01137669.1~~GFUD01137669.1.p1  ORF type:complete len:311 (+),score=66.31 GFUD01137669.1:38-970(+)